MITVLVDHNIEGQIALLQSTLRQQGWIDLLDLHFAWLSDLGIPLSSTDREVWRFAQAHGMYLITANRTMSEPDSLEQTIREEAIETSLPVLTINSIERLHDAVYRETCAERLVEIILYPEKFSGTGRQYIP